LQISFRPAARRGGRRIIVRKLVNLTLHRQGQKEIELARKCGYELDPEPQAPVVGPGQDGLAEAAGKIAAVLEEAVGEGASVLIGGHTGALVFALRSLNEWPEMVVFETERIRDEHDRFVFIPKGLLIIPAKEAEG
jgi:hypothetical protein